MRAILALCVALSACLGVPHDARQGQDNGMISQAETDAESSDAQGYHILSEAELRGLFCNYTIELDRHPSGHSITMAYSPDGSWFESGVRAPLRGTYTISGDRVCTSAGRCSQYLTRGEGYFIRHIDNNLAPTGPAEIHLIPTGGNCGENAP